MVDPESIKIRVDEKSLFESYITKKIAFQDIVKIDFNLSNDYTNYNEDFSIETDLFIK